MTSKLVVTQLKLLFAACVLIGLAYWVHHQYGWRSTLQIWSGVSSWQIVLGALLVIGSHIARVWRVHFAYSTQQPVSFTSTMAVSFVHTNVSFLLPMRLGELVLPTLSRHQLNVDFRFASATLLLIRLFDIHVLLCLLSFFIGGFWFGEYAFLTPLLLIIGLPIGVKLMYFVSNRIKFLRFATTLVDDNRTWFFIYTQTVVIWLTKLSALAMLAAALGNLPITHAWIGTIFADSSALSPVTGFANAGTFELAFSMPLMPLGYELAPLVKVAVNVHIFIFIINICVGTAGFLMLKAKPTPHPRPKEA